MQLRDRFIGLLVTTDHKQSLLGYVQRDINVMIMMPESIYHVHDSLFIINMSTMQCITAKEECTLHIVGYVYTEDPIDKVTLFTKRNFLFPRN